MRRRSAMAVLLLAAGAGGAWAQGAGPFDGQYTGGLTLDRVIDGDCTTPPPAAVYPLTIANGEVRFAYVPRFATTLTGRINAQGTFRARARVHGGTIRMKGQVNGNNVIATITSPSCRCTFRSQ